LRKKQKKPNKKKMKKLKAKGTNFIKSLTKLMT
jgi:hypothetical protein